MPGNPSQLSCSWARAGPFSAVPQFPNSYSEDAVRFSLHLTAPFGWMRTFRLWMWHRVDIQHTQGSELWTLPAPSLTGHTSTSWCQAGTAPAFSSQAAYEHVCSLWKQTQARDATTRCSRFYRRTSPSRSVPQGPCPHSEPLLLFQVPTQKFSPFSDFSTHPTPSRKTQWLPGLSHMSRTLGKPHQDCTITSNYKVISLTLTPLQDPEIPNDQG